MILLLTTLSEFRKLYNIEWMMYVNWKGCRRKWSWPIL